MREPQDMYRTKRNETTIRDVPTVRSEAKAPQVNLYCDTIVDIIPPPKKLIDKTGVMDVFDDLLLYTFSFLEVRDLVNVGQTCKRWREVSGKNLIWQRELEKLLVETNQKKKIEDIASQESFKQLYFKMHHAHTHLEQHHRHILNIRNCQIWTAIVVGLFIPLCLCFGFLYLSIIAPLFMDGYITASVNNLWYASIPDWLFFFTPFIVFICTITIVFLLFIPQRRYARAVQLVQFFEVHWDTYFEASFIAIWIVGWLLWIPLIILGLYLRLLIVPYYVSTSMSYRLAFIPVYLYTLLYLGAPLYVMVQWSLLHKPLMKYSLGCYCIGAAINILVSLQCGLISAKLDQAMDSYWSSVFTPLWILHGLLLMFPGVCCLEIVHPWKFMFVKIGTVMAVVEVFLFPVQIWLILFTLRLDLFITISYLSTFIPLYIDIFVILCIGLASCTCVTAKFINPKFLSSS